MLDELQKRNIKYKNKIVEMVDMDMWSCYAEVDVTASFVS